MARRSTVESHPSPSRRDGARAFWSGRLILIILALMVAEYGYARRAWVIGSVGLVVAGAAFAYALATRRRSRGGDGSREGGP